MIIQVSVECDLLFAQPVENVLDSLRSGLEVETDDEVGCRPFQSLEQIVRYLRVLDLSQCLNASHKSMRA